MNKVNELIDQLRSIVQDNNWKWYEPLINRNETETLLEWWYQGNKLSIYVEEDLITYIKVWGADMDNEMEDGIVTTEHDLKNLWEWLISK